MKTFAMVLCCIFAIAFFAFAENGAIETKTENPETYCPKTRISDNNRCMDCHVIPDFGLKEARPDRALALPYGVKLVAPESLNDNKLYFTIGIVSSSSVEELFRYLYWHPEFSHIILEIHSAGGSLLEAWRIIGMIQEAQNRGITVETRVYGFAASAGFLLAIAGDMGQRFVSPHAELMHHELWSVAFLQVDTPSSKEQEAKVMRHLQDNIHKWIISRCTKSITMDELNEWVKHKDFWMTGKEAVELGFADGTISSGYIIFSR